jgi:hypothetical protein
MVEIGFALAFGAHFWTWAWFQKKEQLAAGKLWEVERELQKTRQALWDAQDEVDRLKGVTDDFSGLDDLFS